MPKQAPAVEARVIHELGSHLLEAASQGGKLGTYPFAGEPSTPQGLVLALEEARGELDSTRLDALQRWPSGSLPLCNPTLEVEGSVATRLEPGLRGLKLQDDLHHPVDNGLWGRRAARFVTRQSPELDLLANLVAPAIELARSIAQLLRPGSELIADARPDHAQGRKVGGGARSGKRFLEARFRGLDLRLDLHELRFQTLIDLAGREIGLDLPKPGIEGVGSRGDLGDRDRRRCLFGGRGFGGGSLGWRTHGQCDKCQPADSHREHRASSKHASLHRRSASGHSTSEFPIPRTGRRAVTRISGTDMV